MASSKPSSQLQVAFSFDTTGSMSRAIGEVRRRISEMIKQLKRDIPGVKIAVIAHGDYCDKDTYVIKHLNLTDDTSRLVDFVNNVEDTGGGDEPECYELMLRLVRRDLTWSTRSQKVLVVIGDAYPHPPSYPQNTDHIDWEEEAKRVAEMGIRIFGVQIGTDPDSTAFFKAITGMSGGYHIKLSEFSTLTYVIMAICYRTGGIRRLKVYEDEVRQIYRPKPIPAELQTVFVDLRQPLATPTVATSPARTCEEKFYFWGCELTPSSSFTWECIEDEVDCIHVLKVKMATLGKYTICDENNIVEVETTNVDGKSVKLPLISMVTGKTNTLLVDLMFDRKATFRLIEGNGPVYLSGQQVIKGPEGFTLNPLAANVRHQGEHGGATGFLAYGTTIRRTSIRGERASPDDDDDPFRMLTAGMGGMRGATLWRSGRPH